MPIRFACPRCEKTLKVDDRFAGRRAKCPNCRVPIEIPEQAPAGASVGSASVIATADAREEPGEEAPAEETLSRSAPEGDVPPIGRSNSASVVESEASLHPPKGAEHEASVRGSEQTANLPSPAPAVAAPPLFEKADPVAGHLVPAASPPDAPPDDREDDQFASPFEVFDDDAEIVYAEGYGRDESERFLVSRTRLAVPRAYVYLQGALLVAVAVLSFVLGWAFGGSGSYRAADAPQGPVTLSGIIRVDGYDGPIAASEGALVAILPGERRPAEKIPVDGLRPSEIGRIVPPRTLGAIREMGGALAVSDSRGEFRAELPQPGEYHVLVVLPDVYRPTTSQIALADLARLGDYFLLPDQLIGDCRYSLQTERVDESKTIEVRFP